MNDGILEYSYSGGTYWSKYNHCRVWENDTYEVIVRDQYGQTATSMVDITNIQIRNLAMPQVNAGDYVEGTWSDSNVTLTVTTTDTDVDIYYSLNDGQSWSLLNGSTYECTSSQGFLFQTRDGVGNKSLSLAYSVKIDKTEPTNLNFTPVVHIGRIINTEVSALDSESAITYSISYDGGTNWSSPQPGKYFEYFNAPSGTYAINCRAYNSAGLYTEGTPVSVTIN